MFCAADGKLMDRNECTIGCEAGYAYNTYEDYCWVLFRDCAARTVSCLSVHSSKQMTLLTCT